MVGWGYNMPLAESLAEAHSLNMSPAGATEVAVVPCSVGKPQAACLTSVLCVAHSM